MIIPLRLFAWSRFTSVADFALTGYQTLEAQMVLVKRMAVEKALMFPFEYC